MNTSATKYRESFETNVSLLALIANNVQSEYVEILPKLNLGRFDELQSRPTRAKLPHHGFVGIFFGCGSLLPSTLTRSPRVNPAQIWRGMFFDGFDNQASFFK
jgi:hypothetical protein